MTSPEITDAMVEAAVPVVWAAYGGTRGNAENTVRAALSAALAARAPGEPAPSALVAEPGEPVAWEQRHRENSGEWSKWYPTSKKAFDLIGTEPDGSLQARPLYAAPPARQDGALREAWRCFHCDEVFTDEDRAREHFGVDESREVACRIKSGAEGSMLTALRRAEADAADAWFKLQNESGEAAQAYYAQAARHQEQLRAAEELGYERGLRDAALAQSAAPVQPQEG